MPELPEVETVVRLLRKRLVSARLIRSDWRVPSMVKGTIPFFKTTFESHSIHDVTRRGKYILIHFDHGWTLVSHLRMEGKYVEKNEANLPISKFAHVSFYFQDGRRFDYEDVRKFGTFEAVETSHCESLPSLHQLGPEPFDIHDRKAFYPRIQRSQRPIKSILLDQTIISGLGNIYVDETLFAARIHPLTPGSRVSNIQIDAILDHSQRILKDAIADGGTRIRSYASGEPIDGQFVLKIQAYQRTGQPCSRCQHRIARITVGGRGTHFCPRCQHDPRYPYVIGITGSMASGKTTLLSQLASNGLATLSADAIVKKLYQKRTIQTQLQRWVGHDVIKDKKVDSQKLLTWLIHDVHHAKKLEAWLHPLVLKQIDTWLQKQKGVVAIEIPLLFQSDADVYCDTIIGVESSQATLLDRLPKRYPMHNLEPYLLLNERNDWFKYRPFIDHVFENNGRLEDFLASIHQWYQDFITALPGQDNGGFQTPPVTK